MTRKTLLALLLLPLAGSAFAAKPCEELKAQIDANISAKGVSGYLLQIMSNAEAEAAPSGKIVGSCGGGTQKILYWRAGEHPPVNAAQGSEAEKAQTPAG